jgi:hypothetical protein
MPVFAAEKIILAAAVPEYVNDRGLERLFGIPPSTGYRLADAGLIRSIYIRERGRKCGQRLWDCSSVRRFLGESSQLQLVKEAAP